MVRKVSDGRIFKPEFIRAKQQIIDGKIEGVTMSEISDEDWAKEFDVINQTSATKAKTKKKKQQQPQGDNFISFREFVAYTLKNIIKPAVYITTVSSNTEENGEGSEGGDASNSITKVSAFAHMISGLIDEMEENDIQEAQNEEALAELEKTEDDVDEGSEEVVKTEEEQTEGGGGEQTTSKEETAVVEGEHEGVKDVAQIEVTGDLQHAEVNESSNQ